MSSLDNPFSSLIKIMREEGGQSISSSFLFGKYKGNKQVETNGITLYSDDLFIDKWLKDRETILIDDIREPLNVGDSVLLANVGEKYVILCKVVSL